MQSSKSLTFFSAPNPALSISNTVHSTQDDSKGNTPYAYVGILYKDNEYFLGALMLGFALSKIQSKFDKVLLVTPDVPQHQIKFLNRYFKIKEIPYIYIHEDSFAEKETIYKEVFTKLNVFDLIEYKKILLLDLDMLVLRNMDHVFELNAPAATFRQSGLQPEQLAPTDFIKLVKNKETHFDEVSGGINAGLMLLEPNRAELAAMLEELKQPLAYKVKAPEQDYLSCRYRNKWRHIDCRYNYQFSLSCVVDYYNYAIQELYNLHFSWYINPWELLFKNREKVLFIIENLRDKYVPDTTYFMLWEQEFKTLQKTLMLEGIDILKLVNMTGMRDTQINYFYDKCAAPQKMSLP